MKAHCVWNEKLQLTASNGTHSFVMDAKKPLGDERGPTPKDYLLSAICGCTAMDVLALLKKHKQPLESFSLDAEAQMKPGHPAVFSEVLLTFRLQGAIDPAVALESVRLSESQFCSVGAMISRVVPVRYIVLLNGAEIGTGQADFSAALAK